MTKKKPTKRGRPKTGRKANVNLYIPAEFLARLEDESKEFGIKSLSKYVAILLSHRASTVERIRKKDIIVVP